MSRSASWAAYLHLKNGIMSVSESSSPCTNKHAILRTEYEDVIHLLGSTDSFSGCSVCHVPSHRMQEDRSSRQDSCVHDRATPK
jgi:hypothetical protein